MTKIKRLATALLAAVMMVSTFAMSASAANNTDRDFTTKIENGWRHENSETAQRLKEDTSSSYCNYSTRTNGAGASGPYQFEAIIYGCNSYSGSYVDCSSFYLSGASRPKAIVTRGSVGLIYQNIYELYGSGSYGQIWGGYYNASGTAKGCWSVDSVGSYNHYN